MRTFLIFALAILCLSTPAYSETYSWEDANGLHFVDDLGKVPAKYRKKAKEKDTVTATQSVIFNSRTKGIVDNYNTEISQLKKQNLEKYADTKYKLISMKDNVRYYYDYSNIKESYNGYKKYLILIILDGEKYRVDNIELNCGAPLSRNLNYMLPGAIFNTLYHEVCMR